MSDLLQPSLLNEAMRSYVHTFSREDRLDAFIEKKRLGVHREQIKAQLDAVLETAEDHLYEFPGGVPWDDEFKQGFVALLAREHPWIDQGSIDCVLSFSGWLCWHEGLNRNPPASRG